MLEVRIDGAVRLHQVATRVRAEGSKDLSRSLSRALSRATQPVERSVRAEADQVMPDRGGYKTVFSRSLRFRRSTRVGGQRAQLIMRTFADGTSERRDINRLEAGRLRHPVFGRSRRIRRGPRAGTALPNPWTVTEIRPGFHRRGTEDAGDEAERELGKVLDEFAARLID